MTGIGQREIQIRIDNARAVTVIGKMTSPYLEQPLVPLGVALPQMLENIEVELANGGLEAAETVRLCHRANLIRWLLAPRQLPESRYKPLAC